MQIHLDTNDDHGLAEMLQDCRELEGNERTVVAATFLTAAVCASGLTRAQAAEWLHSAAEDLEDASVQ